MKIRNLYIIVILVSILSCSKGPVKSLTIDKANKLLKQDTNTTIINVDSPMEYSRYHINGDINIDVLDIKFSDRISMLEKTNSYIVYSKIKSRALSASDIMYKQGFSNISLLDGSYEDIVSQISINP